jgi:hypothetical protein
LAFAVGERAAPVVAVEIADGEIFVIASALERTDPVSLPAIVRVAGRELPAVAENISPGGAFLRVALPPELEEIVASIVLPHGKDLHVRASVCWRRAEPPGVGVKFDRFLEPKVMAR